MNINQETESHTPDNNEFWQERRRHLNPKPKMLVVRNILNVIFMLGALLGVILYLWSDTTLGIIVILTAMAFKLVECTLRFFH